MIKIKINKYGINFDCEYLIVLIIKNNYFILNIKKIKFKFYVCN